jgi:hypothetical protein
MNRDDLGRAAYEEWKLRGGHLGTGQVGKRSDSDRMTLEVAGAAVTIRAELTQESERIEYGRWIDLPRATQEIWCAVGEAVERRLAVLA